MWAWLILVNLLIARGGGQHSPLSCPKWVTTETRATSTSTRKPIGSGRPALPRKTTNSSTASELLLLLRLLLFYSFSFLPPFFPAFFLPSFISFLSLCFSFLSFVALLVGFLFENFIIITTCLTVFWFEIFWLFLCLLVFSCLFSFFQSNSFHFWLSFPRCFLVRFCPVRSSYFA